MVGMSAGVGTSGVVCVNGRDACLCGDFWSSVCVNGRDVCWCGDFWSSVCEW